MSVEAKRETVAQGPTYRERIGYFAYLNHYIEIDP